MYVRRYFLLPLMILTCLCAQKLARDFLKARKMAPPRPHPLAPQSGGIAQKVAGMQGTLHDKVCTCGRSYNTSVSLINLLRQVVETLEGRQFVDLKYGHPDV